MTYKNFLKRFSGDRSDYAFGAALFGSLFSLAFVICTIVSIAEASFTPLLGLFAYIGGMVAGIAFIFVVGTFIYWFIVER